MERFKNIETISSSPGEKIFTKLALKLSLISHSIYFSKAFGLSGYQFLVILDYAIFTVLLFLGSYPYKRESHEKNTDYLNTSSFDPYSLRDTPENVFPILISFCVILTLPFLITLQIMITKKSYEGVKDASFIRKVLFSYVGLTRTLLTYPYSFFCMCSIASLAEDHDGYSSASYLLIIMLVIMTLLYMYALFISFDLGNLPLLNGQVLPWLSLSVKESMLRETLKFIVVAQLYYQHDLSNQSAIFGIYQFILTSIIFYNLLYRCRYVDKDIDAFNYYGAVIVLSMSILCFMRIAFHVQLLEIIIFKSVLVFCGAKIFKAIEHRRLKQAIDSLRNTTKLSGKSLQIILIESLAFIDRLNDSDISHLRQMALIHTSKCVDSNCICQKAYRLSMKPFRNNLENPKSNESKNKTRLKRNRDQAPLVSVRELSSGITNINDRKLVPLESVFENDYTIRDIDEIMSPHSKSNEYPGLTQKESNNQDTNSPAKFPIYDILNNMTFQFETNISGVNVLIEDFFKEVYDIETHNSKLLNSQHQKNSSSSMFLSQPLSHYESLIRKHETSSKSRSRTSDEENSSESQQGSKIFKDQKEALRFIFIQLLQITIKDVEGGSGSLSSLFKNISHQMVYVSFINQVFAKHFQAVFQLLRINQQISKLGFLQKVRFITMEQLILQDALSQFKSSSNGIDYSFFIDGNQQQAELDKYYDSATTDIIQFWRGFKSDDKNVVQLMNLGRQISQQVHRLKILTKKLEDNPFVKKDFGKYQIYALFHLELLHDPMTSNQMANFIKNSLFLRQKNNKFMEKINSQVGQPIQLQNNLNDIGVAIVSAWGGQRGQWDFMYGNKAFCELFKIPENQLTGRSINSIMPKSFASFHDHIIRKFYIDGQPKILGKLRIALARNNEGFIFPIQIRVNFYYHDKFSYSFIVQAEKVKHFNLYNDDASKINIEDCMYFITDVDMNVQDYSSNFLALTGQTKQKMDSFEEHHGSKENLANFISGISKVVNDDKSNETILQKSGGCLVNRTVNMAKFNKELDTFDASQPLPCLLNYFQQSFLTQNDEHKTHIFMLLPLNKHPEYELMIPRQKSMQFAQRTQQSTDFIKSSVAQIISGQNGISSSYQNQDNLDKSSLNSEDGLDLSSISSTNSSSNSNLMQSHYAKNLLFQNRAPKLLKLNAILIICVFLGFVIVSVYNLAAFLDKWSSISDRLNVIALLSNRNVNIRAALLGIKNLQSIAYNLDSQNVSTVLPSNMSRFDYYKTSVENSLSIVRDQADKFNQFIGINQAYIGFNMEFDNFRFLTEEGYVYSISIPFKQATKIFSSYAVNVSIPDLVREKPDLNITNYCKNYSSLLSTPSAIGNRSLTDLEKTLFTVSENGMYTFQELGKRQYLLLRESAQDQTESSKLILSITTFISMAVVSLLCLIIYPLLTKAHDRVYTPVQYFSMLDKDLYQKCLEKAIQFKKQLRLKIGKQQAEKQSMMSLDKELSLDKSLNSKKQGGDSSKSQSERDKIQFWQPSTSSRRTKVTDSKRGIFEDEGSNKSIQRTAKNIKGDEKKGKLSKFVAKTSNKNISGSQDNRQNKERRKSKFIDPLSKANKDEELEEIEEEKEEEEDESSQSEQSNRDKNKKRSHRNTKRGHKQSHRDANLKLNGTYDLSNFHSNRQKLFQLQINKLLLQSKIKLFGVIILVIGFLNSSLLLSYYQSQVVFQNDSSSIDSLASYYTREECIYNLLLFMREKIIRNYTVTANFYDTPATFTNVGAVYGFVERCQQNENQLYAQRNNYPVFLENARDGLETMESASICNMTYQQLDPSKVKGCETAMNSLLEKGQQNAILYLITQINQMNINFDGNKGRSKQVLLNYLYSKNIQDFTDFALYYLKSTMDTIQDLAQSTSVAYFDQAKSNYLLSFSLFTSFTVLMVVILGSILYIKIKQLMLQMQNMLCLVPLEDIQQYQRQKLEAFLNK